MDVSEFLDIYQIRSLSIQQAYMDINNEEEMKNNNNNNISNNSNSNKVIPKILSSAFARITYGGNVNRYLGGLVIKMNSMLKYH